MNADIVEAENAEFVLARLRLAQSILEESDLLDGSAGYHRDRAKWWLHPRHEREALVAYLLLTCFDRLGQDKKFTTFSDWLKSKKHDHISERNEALDSLLPDVTPIHAADALADHYQSLYGVRNAFCQGINNLPEQARQLLLSSVHLMFSPEHGMYGPNVSTSGLPLEDKKLELNLKLKYLYNKRNRFTHRLEQYQSSSTPMMSDAYSPNGSSWAVEIRDGRLNYYGAHQEVESRKTGGAYVYGTNNWPFVLFEVLYMGIGIPFDRTSIQLKFQVLLFNDARPDVMGTLNGVDHGYLKDFHSLADDFWTGIAGAQL